MGKFIKVLLITVVIGVIFYATKLYNGHNAMIQAPLLVKDIEYGELPKQFRTMLDKAEHLPASSKGLGKIHASGSGAFSETQIKAVADKLQGKHITIVDLRQESHGFINGEAVSWYGVANAANKGKTQEEVLQDETSRLAAIKALTTIDVADIKDKSDGIIKDYSPVPTKVEKVQTEAELAASLGLGYKRFTVRDHAAPTDEQVDGYIKLIRDLPKDGWLHVHCRGGKGRTTTFLAVYDMMENAKDVSLDEIIARQHALGGSNLFKDEVDEYKKSDAITRKEFLERFYQYAKENNDGFETLWTDWLKQPHG